MTLRKKTLLVLGVTVAIGAAVLYAAASSLLMSSFAQFEERITRQNLVRVLDAFASDLSGMSSVAGEWSRWGAVHAFVQDGDDAFRRAYLVPATYRNLDLNLIVFTDSAGRLVYGQGFDQVAGREVSIPPEFLAQVRPGSPLLSDVQNGRSVAGLLLVPGAEMSVVAWPLLDASRQGTSLGTVILGRYLTAERVDVISSTTRLSVGLYRLDDTQMPADAREAVASLARMTPTALTTPDPVSIEWPADEAGGMVALPTLVHALDRERIAGYATLPDLFGQPALLLRVEGPRSVYRQGETNLRYYLLSLLAIGLVMGVVVIFSTEALTLARLGHLNRALGQLAVGPGRSARVRVAGRDEITSVASTINEMLAAVEQTQVAQEKLLQESQARAERLSLLNHIANSVTSTLKLDELLEVIYREVTTVLRADAFFIALYYPDTRELEYRINVDQGLRQEPTREPVGEGWTAHVVATRQSLLIQDYEAERDHLPPALFWGTMAAPGSWLGVPLLVGQEVAGIISVQTYDAGVYTTADQQLLETIADGVAMALEHARLYTSLREANQRLQAAIQAKDEMIQNVSHELRTPLTAIQGYSEVMLEGDLGELTEEQQGALSLISQRSHDLTRLVNGILTLQTFTAESLHPSPVEAATVLDVVAGNWRALGRTHLSIEVQHRPGLVINADKDYLREVLDQLINNAVKFTPEGGTICLSAEASDGRVYLAVSDTGIGIPPDRLDRVFERFYQVDGTTRRSHGGAGIGLAVARKIIEAHQGRIWAESPGRLGCGTTFVLDLPRP